MSADDSRRRHPRYTIAWTVRLRAADWDDALQLAVGNISRGGVFVCCEQDIPVGARLEVVLELPDGMTLTVAGEVVHSISPARAESQGMAPGVGIRFDERHAIDLNLLEGMAAANSAGRHAALVDDEDAYVTWLAVLAENSTGVELETTAHKLLDPVPAVAAADAAQMTFAPEEPTPPDAAPPGVEIPHSSPDWRAPRPGVRAADREPVFGIDFGTTFTSIAVADGGRVRVLADGENQTSLPSVVSYPEQGAPLVGWPAREKIATLPTTTIVSPKRLIGRRFQDDMLAAYLAGSPVRFFEGADGQVHLDVHGQQLTVMQVGAEVYRHIARVGETASGVPVRRVVLSAPVSFSTERKALQRTAELAGLEVLGIIDEPVAAAMAFGASIDPGRTIAVYDFGGGTFDFTVLKIIGPGRYSVIAEAGDPWLGGDDFDLSIANHAADLFWRANKVDLRHRQVEWQRLLFAAQNAKRKLSIEQEVELYVRGILISLRGPIDLYLLMDRDLITGLCGDLVERSFSTVSLCLELAGLGPGQIDHVVLTGGTSRSPLVRQRAQEFFGREITVNYDPELGVVSGNALYGRALSLRR